MKARQDCSIELRDLTLAYGERDIIRGLNLDVRRGEILSLLGPSGCGKTTTLHAIAGLIVPRKGSVVIDGVDQTDVPINRRNVGMVFQGYALFPHMTVFDNVSYGLRIKSVAKAEIRERTMRALALVGMEQYAQRKPRQLSGGQQQRVAIARTMVMEPRVLLLDEPCPTWTRSCGTRSAATSSASCASCPLPRCSSRTTRKRRCSCPTGSC